MLTNYTSAPIIGLIGGMGSLATIKTYSCLVGNLDKDQRHIIIDNLPLENVFDNLSNGTISRIKESIKRLGTAGVRIVGIPCNTVHCFARDIERECNFNDICFLSIIERTAIRMLSQRYSRVGVLATPTGAKLYRRSLEFNNVKVELPSLSDQHRINELVRLILVDASPILLYEAREALTDIGEGLLGAGSEAIVLGCTELPLAFHGDLPPHYYSTIDILAESIAKEAAQWKL